jgi:hypothetical protein
MEAKRARKLAEIEKLKDMPRLQPGREVMEWVSTVCDCEEFDWSNLVHEARRRGWALVDDAGVHCGANHATPPTSNATPS